MAAYELKRKRTFQASWKKEFPWVILKDVEESPTMFCEVCLKFLSPADKSSSFFKGTSSFRKQMLECHDKSKHHLACMAAKRVADNPSSGALSVLFTKQNAEANVVITKLII